MRELRIVRLGALAVCLIFIAGCAGYSCERVRTHAPREGEERTSVLANFGEPAASQETESGRIDVYELAYEECRGLIMPVPFIGVLPLWGGRDAFWAVTYDKSGQVRIVEVLPDAETAESALTTRSIRLVKQAAQEFRPHTASGGFGQALRVTPENTRQVCQDANQSLPEAQVSFAFWHRPDIWEELIEEEQVALTAVGVTPDVRVAYMWYTLADRNGAADAVSYRNTVSLSMTPVEIADAEAMIAGWHAEGCP